MAQSECVAWNAGIRRGTRTLRLRVRRGAALEETGDVAPRGTQLVLRKGSDCQARPPARRRPGTKRRSTGVTVPPPHRVSQWRWRSGAPASSTSCRDGGRAATAAVIRLSHQPRTGSSAQSRALLATCDASQFDRGTFGWPYSASPDISVPAIQ
jgi:hypothetical protein